MIFRKCLISLFCLLSYITAFGALEYTPSDIKRALSELDDSLSHREAFIQRRQAEIDKLIDSLNRHPSVDLYLAIGDRYTAFNNDSALYYLAQGKKMAPTRRQEIPFDLRRAMLLPLTGSFTSAISIFDSIPTEGLSAEELSEYYDGGRQMMSYITSFSAENDARRRIYHDRELDLQKKLIDILPKNSVAQRYNLGEYYYQNGEKGRARALLEHVFENESTGSKYRARAAHHLSRLAQERGDQLAYVYYLSQSALADVSAATREVASLQELGRKLLAQGDVDRSYFYLTEALANAVECGAPMRMVESARSLPTIEKAKTAQMQRRDTVILIVGIILVVVLAVLGAALWRLRLEIKRMKIMQESLRAANRTKEVYISQFLSLCSIYMDKLNQFCKIANSKIAAGKVDDLYRLTKSGKFVEEQSKEFYDVFDNAFLHIYPDFVSRVNALLRPDEQIELKEGEILNTDLRILAFMRLGIDESSRIAQVLNYSINTIYAYRNRTKSHAINRETFEDDVMAIEGQ